MRLSQNFSLNEFLVSQTAARHGGEMLDEQNSPSEDVITSLSHLVDHCLQPLRTLLNTSMTITSGYRGPLLNAHIGSKPTSQHIKGEAADVRLSHAIKTQSHLKRYKNIVENQILQRTGLELRSDANANFYLFAVAAIYINELDIDQLIHEYGEDGCPSWVHMSSSANKNRRQILKINSQGAQILTLEEALKLGT